MGHDAIAELMQALAAYAANTASNSASVA